MGLTGALCGFFGLVLLVCNGGFAAERGEMDAAIERGLAWVAAHPPSSRDGGLPDIVDEGLFYLTVDRLSSRETPPASGYRRAFEQSLAGLEASPAFERWLNKPSRSLLEHYHLLLAVHLGEIAGKPVASRARVIEDARRTLAASRHEIPTFRLAVAVLLEHLGAGLEVDIDGLLDAGLVNQVARGEAWLFGHPLDYYAVVHEVAVLTDFGRLPVSPWLMKRREHIAAILQEGARRAVDSGYVDLLAELLLCSDMLGLAMTGELRRGVGFIVASQRADGSWGEQATFRANRRRHAVQTATAALMAYRNSALSQCGVCEDSPCRPEGASGGKGPGAGAPCAHVPQRSGLAPDSSGPADGD
jgi:hypothetical protein